MFNVLGSSQNKIFSVRLRYPLQAESSDTCINCLVIQRYSNDSLFIHLQIVD
jgi:hypothetical protein